MLLYFTYRSYIMPGTCYERSRWLRGGVLLPTKKNDCVDYRADTRTRSAIVSYLVLFM